MRYLCGARHLGVHRSMDETKVTRLSTLRGKTAIDHQCHWITDASGVDMMKVVAALVDHYNKYNSATGGVVCCQSTPKP